MRMKSLLRPTLLCLLAASAAAPALAQHKTYYYRPVTREAQYSSSTSNVYRRNDGEEASAEARGKTRYTYTPHYRDRHLYSPYRYQPATRYPQPPGHRSGVWWGVGSRLPAVYYAPAYVIDYQRYRLPTPPAGFRWVRVENDVYLVHSASGLVRDALYQMFY
jgi:Ni/Co efflux regulator RcnB